MAKLYAEILSDKGGRIASKSGDESITVTFRNGNYSVFDVTFTPDEHKRGKIAVMSYMQGRDYIRTLKYDDIPY